MSFIAVAIGGGALIGAIGSGISGSMQAGAAKNAAQLQYQEQQQALQFQEQEWNQQQQNMAPWVKQGQGALETSSGILRSWLWSQKPRPSL